MNKISLKIPTIILLFIMLLLSSCFFLKKEKYHEDYNKLSFKEVNYWGNDKKIEDFIPAFAKSCAVFAKRSDDYIVTTKPMITKVYDWKKVCKPILNNQINKRNIKKYFENNFDIYLIGNKNEGIVSGYYHIFMQGSRNKEGKYIFPIYGVPRNLLTINLSDFKLKNKLSGQLKARVSGNKVVPYFDSKQIEKGAIDNNANIIAYVDNPIERYLLHVQGSGSVLMTNGQKIKLDYASQNGYQFTGIGTKLIKSGFLKGQRITVKNMVKAYHRYPNEVMNMILDNDSYIFFKESDTLDVIGGSGVGLTGNRSLAVDLKYISYGVPVWLEMKSHKGRINHMMVAQDRGGAISGKNRLDYYWGEGHQAAEDAEQTMNPASVYILLPKK